MLKNYVHQKQIHFGYVKLIGFHTFKESGWACKNISNQSLEIALSLDSQLCKSSN